VTAAVQSFALLGLTSFEQNVILLGLTALLTGLSSRMCRRRLTTARRDSGRSGRQNSHATAKLIEAQAKFLDDLTNLLWRWRYTSIKVAYYGGQETEDRYEAAWREYDESIWEVLNGVRSEVSLSRRLVSEPAYRTLRSIYEEDMVKLDRQLSGAREAHPLDQRRMVFGALNRDIYDGITDRIDATLAEVAAQIGLSSAARSSQG